MELPKEFKPAGCVECYRRHECSMGELAAEYFNVRLEKFADAASERATTMVDTVLFQRDADAAQVQKFEFDTRLRDLIQEHDDTTREFADFALSCLAAQFTNVGFDVDGSQGPAMSVLDSQQRVADEFADRFGETLSISPRIVDQAGFDVFMHMSNGTCPATAE